jgi:hypothetical protein
MGRWAQQRKRGGHLGDQPGLPAGPSVDKWNVFTSAGLVKVAWSFGDPVPFDFWRSRWRRPSLSMLWTLNTEDAALTDLDEEQSSPWAAVGGQQQDCEIAYCDVAGTLLSGWSGFQSVTP